MAFPHKVIVISGASTGIGAELAVQLARIGCTLGLMARRADLLQQVAARVAEAGAKAVCLPCDVADSAAVAKAVTEFAAAHGPIDCVIANAGIGQPVSAREFDPAMVEQIFRVNMLGMTNLFYAALPDMLQRMRGHLVAVSSLASYQGMPQDGGYSASKAAQRIHCEGLRIELRGSGVDVTTICPGFIRTPMTDRNEFDMPLLMEVAPAARRIVRAIARRRREYRFPWLLWRLIKVGLATPRWLYDAALASQGRKLGQARRTQKRSTEVQA